MTAIPRAPLDVGMRLSERVLAPMKSIFVGKDEIVDLLGIGLASGENLFLFGPPGTAKSALVHELGRRIEGRIFDYLLTRFSEPNELFGPFDIRRLREGELVSNTEGMLPEASLVFLDELLNANSAVLNSLLTVLNERVFRRGRETLRLPLLMAIGASNRLPDDEALAALFDRFLLRVRCANVDDDGLEHVLEAGWQLETARAAGDETAGSSTDTGVSSEGRISTDEIKTLQRSVAAVDLSPTRAPYLELIRSIRNAGIAISDRRAVKFQRLVAASALLCGRSATTASDLWVLRHVWDREEQEQVLRAIVAEAVREDRSDAVRHPRSLLEDAPDPELMARDIDTIAGALDEAEAPERSRLEDRLGTLADRCHWIADATQREFLEGRIRRLLEDCAHRGEAS